VTSQLHNTSSTSMLNPKHPVTNLIQSHRFIVERLGGATNHRGWRVGNMAAAVWLTTLVSAHLPYWPIFRNGKWNIK